MNVVASPQTFQDIPLAMRAGILGRIADSFGPVFLLCWIEQ